MGQLIRSTTTSFEAIRFSQNARLVPSDQVDIERRKAIARHNAFCSRSSSGGNIAVDMNYIHRVNKTFAVKKAVVPASSTVHTRKAASQLVPRPSSRSVAVSSSASAYPAVEGEAPVTAFEGTAAATYMEESFSSTSHVESEAAYDTQRGAFELRVAKGELSYVPAMVMTIVTQYPAVNFEYLGGFNYVPPSWEPMGNNINYSA